MIITISGTPGAGKSTVAKLLSKKLRWKCFSTGDIRGTIAQKRGITIDELNLQARKDPTLHGVVDTELKRLSRSRQNLIIDTWMGWFFIPNSAKVFLDVNADEGARRVYQEQHSRKPRTDEPRYRTVNEAQKVLMRRVQEWRSQILRLYGKPADFLKRRNYDLVIDTTTITASQATKKILEFIKNTKTL